MRCPRACSSRGTRSGISCRCRSCLRPAYSRLVWGIFFEKVITETLLPALTDKFRPALDDFVRTHWPHLRSMAEGGIELRVANSRLMLRRPGYVIKPHRDPRWAFLTCLVYLPRPKDVESYGTQIYRLRNEPRVTHSSPLWVDPVRVRAGQGRSGRAEHSARVPQFDWRARRIDSERRPTGHRAISLSGALQRRGAHEAEVGRQSRRRGAVILGCRTRHGVLMAETVL